MKLFQLRFCALKEVQAFDPFQSCMLVYVSQNMGSMMKHVARYEARLHRLEREAIEVINEFDVNSGDEVDGMSASFGGKRMDIGCIKSLQTQSTQDRLPQGQTPAKQVLQVTQPLHTQIRPDKHNHRFLTYLKRDAKVPSCFIVLDSAKAQYRAMALTPLWTEQ
jgi:hypothetical protein